MLQPNPNITPKTHSQLIEKIMADNMEQLKMCELRGQGLMEEIDRLSGNPTVVCGKCGLKADNPDQLHNPRPLMKKKLDSFWG